MNCLLLKSSVWNYVRTFCTIHGLIDLRKPFGNSSFVLILFSADLPMPWEVEIISLQGNGVLFYRDLKVFLFSAAMSSGSQLLNPEMAPEDSQELVPSCQ